MATEGQGKGLLIAGGVLLVLGVAGIGLALGLFISPASQVQDEIEALRSQMIKVESQGSQVQDDIEAVKIQLRKEMDKNKDACPIDDTWTSLATGCYLFFSGNISWDQASNSCHEKGGFLAEIDSQAKWDTLVAAMSCQGWKITSAPIVGVHIGLHKKGGNWQWDNSGKNLTSCTTRWNYASPSGDGNCAGLWGSVALGATWNDYSCSKKHHGERGFGVICET